ncbi:MAG: hypothetical protein VKS61_12375 [Candidatus Sericytochromatia bacterium]|nr:hypothetical protein [Candidatus Sericytochromatia bacterium]
MGRGSHVGSRVGGALALALASLSCTVHVNQPTVTGIEMSEPRLAPPTMPPGVRIVDPALGDDFEVPRTSTTVRLPGPDDLPPGDGRDPVASGVIDQESLTSGFDFEVRGPGRVGQRFRAGASGRLTAVAFRLRAVEGRATTGRLSLHPMAEDGSPGDEVLARTRTLPLLAAGQPGGWVKAELEPPPRVGRNLTYVWVLQPTDEMSVRVVAGTERSYPDGTGWLAPSTSGRWSGAKVDFAFRTWVAP